jgi:NAD(P)-dependent dehydrogenase (short-subunit alcohol dehydrogenase family)
MTAPTSPHFSAALPSLVMVTGASSGLGKIVSGQLLADGCQVLGIDVAEGAPELTASHGYQHARGSVADEAFWSALADGFPVGGSLGLVTNAAVLHVGDAASQPPDQWRQTFDVNVIGTMLAFRTVLPFMVRRGGGRIVAVASVDAHFAEQQLSAYSASKAAVSQFARTVALDYARAGVNVNVVCPGPMMAGLFERHLASAADPTAFLATRERRQPFGEILDPAMVADGIRYLLSDAARGLTGATMTIDGGLTAGFDFRTGEEGASVA